MLLFAIVADAKSRPFPRGRGVCPICLGEVRAKCGSIKVHHWAHVCGQDCDTWSEGIGPWHLCWQDCVRPEFVEVAVGAHRADILGNDDTVIELQHSAISPAEIREREHHYGKMIWLFDATNRFGGLRSGSRFFFSFGRTRHLQSCLKPVVLDFGEFLVEVEALTDLIKGFSGFGILRDRAWFATKHLSTRRNERPLADNAKRTVSLDVWASRPPWKLTNRPTEWRDPELQLRKVYEFGCPYLPLANSQGNQLARQDWPVWWDIIAQFPLLANGWTQADMQEMQSLLGGAPIIFDGLLRLMPARTQDLQARVGPETMTKLLQKAQAHVDAGRIPVLEDAAVVRLRTLARSQVDSAQGEFLARLENGRGRRRWLPSFSE